MQSLKKIHVWAQMKVLLSITQSISKIFKPNFLYLLTNKRYKSKNISDGIFIRSPGSCPRGSTWGYLGGLGGQKKIFSAIQPDLVCEFLTSMAHATAQFFWSPPPWALGRGQKVKYQKISITKSISKVLKPNFVCLLTNERYKTYQKVFSFGRLGHTPGVGLGGTMGGWVVQKIFFRNSTRFGV